MSVDPSEIKKVLVALPGGKGRAAASDEPLTVAAVAKQFVIENEGKLLFCHSSKQWHLFTGAKWAPEKTDLAYCWARELSLRMAEGGPVASKKAAGSGPFPIQIERDARADRAFAKTADDLDADPMLLGTPGGTVDLRTGHLRAADPADLITKTTAVAPSEDEDCPRWLQFLREVTGGDMGLVAFLQQWSGYSLTGKTTEHALVFAHGAGGNGKSVYLNTASGILGDYAVTAPMDAFTASRNDRHPTDIAMLRGARFVTASETEEGRAWAEARIKQITGGDKISARFMRQDFFEFRPQFKLMVVGNHKPEIKTVDDAIRRRVNFVPFTFKPENPDRELEEKLKAEWPGILRWMINGCLDWQERGLVRPEVVRVSTAAYFDEQDIFRQWLDDDCDLEPGNEHKWQTAGELRASWKRYADAHGGEVGNHLTFTAHLHRHGVQQVRRNKGRGYVGICLRSSLGHDA